MTRTGTRWKALLTEATDAVQAVISNLPARERRTIVGRGASGDETLEADREAERELIRVLSKVHGIRFVSEEVGELGRRDAAYVAVIDPLDGSANFANGIPFYCTSVAILDGDRLSDARFAAVRNLITGETYFAERGLGATKSGRKLSTSNLTRLEDAVIGVDISGASRALVNKIAPLVGVAHRQVHFGANALELCLVSEGAMEGFMDLRKKMRVTDIAAGQLLVKEAGGTVFAEDGSDIDPEINLDERFSCVAAANPSIRARLLETIH